MPNNMQREVQTGASDNTQQPEGKQILESFTCTTDVDSWSDSKKWKLFNQASREINGAKGTLSKELKKVTEHMASHFKKCLIKMNQLQEENNKLKEENDELKKNAVSTTSAATETDPFLPRYANTVKNKKPEYVVLVKKAAGAEEKSDLRTELFKDLKAVETNVDILRTMKRNETLVVQVRSEEQQKAVINQMKNNNQVECNLPSKRIPSIKISEIDKNMSKEDILLELESKENIKREDAQVKIILNNTKYRTNRAIVALNEEDTTRLLRKREVKMGLKIHPVEPDYGVVQCKKCNKYGHFHMSKDKSAELCKSKDPVCVHCGGAHDLKDCKVKENRSRAKCSNCAGNHRAYDARCPRRAEVIEKLKLKFACLA